MKIFTIFCIFTIIMMSTSTLADTEEPLEAKRSGEHAVTKELRQSVSPQEILELFKAGNLRFLSGKSLGHNYHQQVKDTAAGQYPAAIVLSCIDSRVSPEIVFDLGIGDIFDVRVAGNVVNEDIAGSMEYACNLAGSKVILVMGHTNCGAVKGAIDDVKMGNLTGLLTKLNPAVDAVQHVDGEHSSKNKQLVDAVARNNVMLTVEQIRQISPILRQLEEEKNILIRGCLYDVNSGRVEFLE